MKDQEVRSRKRTASLKGRSDASYSSALKRPGHSTVSAHPCRMATKGSDANRQRQKGHGKTCASEQGQEGLWSEAKAGSGDSPSPLSCATPR